jgi:uncharacterized protein (TIGR02757 family)
VSSSRSAAAASDARRLRSLAPSLQAQLDALIAHTDHAARREDDPVSFAHRYSDPDDREVVALVAALLAFGNVKAIRASVARVLDALGASPARAIETAPETELAARLGGFVHRVYLGSDVARVLAGAASLRRTHGTLAHALEVLAAPQTDEPSVEERASAADASNLASRGASRAPLLRSLAAFGDALRGPAPHRRGLVHLVPDVRRGSACKRLLLFYRWMCRPADGVDLGLSRFPTSALVIPLDTHIHRIARNLGLTRRADASLRTALEITDALARFDAVDPVRYDFALCHLGVSRACPSRRDPARCSACVLRGVCRHWRRG